VEHLQWPVNLCALRTVAAVPVLALQKAESAALRQRPFTVMTLDKLGGSFLRNWFI
jgi:hypothetical protein